MDIDEVVKMGATTFHIKEKGWVTGRIHKSIRGIYHFYNFTIGQANINPTPGFNAYSHSKIINQHYIDNMFIFDSENKNYELWI